MVITISKAAEQAGVGIETIRFYERKGLVEQPPKPSQGFRHYPTDTVARIRFIRQAQELGFSLREIEDMLALQVDASADCADMNQRARRKLDQIHHKIVQLQRMQAALEQLITVCPGSGALEQCPIVEALNSVGMETPTLHAVEHDHA